MNQEQLQAEKPSMDQQFTGHRITGQEKLAILGIRNGKTNLELAEELHISKHTATKHFSNVY
jgi:DNA-binding NarL/FixJ family response regulator